MADDWQVGDLALCVASHGWVHVDDQGHDKGFRPVGGGIYRVCTVHEAGRLYLMFDEAPLCGFNAICFRKIKPLTDEERVAFEADLRAPGHDLPTHTPQAPAREVVALPARSETHTPLQGRAGLSAHNQSHAAEVSHV